MNVNYKPVVSMAVLCNRQTDALVSLDGRRRISERLNPGTRPGRTRACSLAKFVMNVTTALISSNDRLLLFDFRPPACLRHWTRPFSL